LKKKDVCRLLLKRGGVGKKEKEKKKKRCVHVYGQKKKRRETWRNAGLVDLRDSAVGKMKAVCYSGGEKKGPRMSRSSREGTCWREGALPPHDGEKKKKRLGIYIEKGERDLVGVWAGKKKEMEKRCLLPAEEAERASSWTHGEKKMIFRRHPFRRKKRGKGEQEGGRQFQKEGKKKNQLT